MARIALITSEMAGRVDAMCELADRLEAAGHQVTVASPGPIGELMAAHRRPFVDLRPPLAPSPMLGPPAGLLTRASASAMRMLEWRNVAERRRAAVEALDTTRFGDWLVSESVDLALIDIELPMHIIVSSATAVRTGAWTTMLSVRKLPGVPPLGSSIVPGWGWKGSRLGIEAAWARFRLLKWAKAQRLRLTRVGTDRISVLRSLADRVGFELAGQVSESDWLAPFVFPEVPVMSFNVWELEFPHTRPDSIRYVGPVLGPRPEGDRLDDHGRLALDRAIASRADGTSTALIYAGFGSWHQGDDSGFLRELVAVIAARPKWTLVLGLGSRSDPAELGDLPTNVIALRWAPQREILEHADAAIHHGGISTVNECLRAAVPMVVYPFDFLDQPGNAARVVFHGLGERGLRNDEAAPDIGARLDRVLGDDTIATNLRRLHDGIVELERANTAVEAVENLL